jgi:hypothetical protein
MVVTSLDLRRDWVASGRATTLPLVAAGECDHVDARRVVNGTLSRSGAHGCAQALGFFSVVTAWNGDGESPDQAGKTPEKPAVQAMPAIGEIM